MSAGPASLVAFDLETTGVDPFVDVPVSYGFAWRDASGSVTTLGGLINPGRPIPAGASAIHGITDAAVRDAPALEVALDTIVDRLTSVWAAGGAIVGMNVAYDLTMVDAQCRRLSRGGLVEPQLGAVLDVLILDRHVDRYRRGKRTLGDLCAHYGVDPGDAHSAPGDAAASLAVLERILSDHPELADLAPGVVNETLAGWYREWLTSFSAYLEKRGGAPIERGRYAWPVHGRAEPPTPRS